MVKGGEAFSHTCYKITGIKICNSNFHKGFVTFDHSRSSGQQTQQTFVGLQDVFSVTIFRLPRRLEDVLEDVKLLR